jgi:hypothetical protein
MTPAYQQALEELAEAVRAHLAGPSPERLPAETRCRLGVLVWRIDVTKGQASK